MTKKSTGTFMIKDLDTLRTVADPLRAQILELIIQEPQTIRQISEKLGHAPSKLYYHFGLLEKVGLIAVAETRMVANMVEKVYRATAANIDIEPSLCTFTTEVGKETIRTIVTPVLDVTREDLLRSLQAREYQLDRGAAAQPREMIVNRCVSHLSEPRVNEFRERLKALLQEFEQADEGAPSVDSPNYALTIAYYPSFYFEPEDSSTTETQRNRE